jgi:exopolysaccharide production protein ExoZ
MKIDREQKHSIQILRAVAVSSVVYLHTLTLPLFGNFGVDLFFVISGFVMCMVIKQRKPRPGAFLLDRITRIVPTYWLVTTMVLVVVWMAPNLLSTTTANFSDYVKSLFFIPYFRKNGSLYPMLMQGWSLNYEMLYYAVITLVLVVDRVKFMRPLGIVLALIYPLSKPLDPSSAIGEFLQNTMWFEFVLGIACFHYYRHPLLQRIPKAVILLLSLGAYFSMVWLEGSGDRIFVAGVPSVLLLLFMLQLDGEIRRLDAKILRFIVHVGDASYATYLSHTFIVGLLERVIFTRLGVEKNMGTTLFTVACALVAGSIFYYLVDRPLTRRVRLLTHQIAAPDATLTVR